MSKIVKLSTAIRDALTPAQRRLLKKSLMAEHDFLTEEIKDLVEAKSRDKAMAKQADADDVLLMAHTFFPPENG